MTEELKQSVYLNFQVPARELEWLLNQLNQLPECDIRIWVSAQREYGNQAQLHTSIEKVVGYAKVMQVRMMCSYQVAQQVLSSMKTSLKPDGIQWQIQPLLESGSF